MTYAELKVTDRTADLGVTIAVADVTTRVSSEIRRLGFGS